ncbi:putative acetyltransferase [Campylobacter ornithocola]|nr:putative acetyltransferase [Campylobacter ornithocola]
MFYNNISQKDSLIQKDKNNFFFYDNKLLFYFVNDIKKYNLKPSFVKLIGNNEKYFLKHEEFLALNDFKLYQTFKQMTLKNENLNFFKFEFIKKPVLEDIEECYNFLSDVFKHEFNLFYKKQNFQRYINNILIYKENNKIRGILFYSSHLNYAYLDYIATQKNLRYKYISYALLNHFFIENKDKKFYKLFVNIDNFKAINFYKRSNFNFTKLELRFYKNYDII